MSDSESRLDPLIFGYYKSIAAGFMLAVASFGFFLLIIYCVYQGINIENITNTQSLFCILGVLSGMVVIYFGLCYLVGAETSRVYTENVIKVLKAIKPEENGIIDKLFDNKIFIFFLGLSFFSFLTIITYFVAQKYIV